MRTMELDVVDLSREDFVEGNHWVVSPWRSIGAHCSRAPTLRDSLNSVRHPLGAGPGRALPTRKGNEESNISKGERAIRYWSNKDKSL
jgi:hypothetical protein